ncbi:MAG TPA: BON domain-containing protein [Candidatus Binatus sp.]|uniref:BON domain-containing protein n=1 Tax=Candidatus Binatus sp. TaxID=2811406 RepID=UPI002F3E5C14
MKLKEIKFASMMLLCGLATVALPVSSSHAQQETTVDAPATTANRSITLEHDKVQTSAEHRYNSPAERANDDLLITEVKSSLAERGISDRYPVEVDCDHGTIQLSGVVASAEQARQAETIALNTKGVVGVKDKLTWR